VIGNGMFDAITSFTCLAQAGETSVEEFRWLNSIPAWVLILVVLPLVVFAVRWVYYRENLRGSPSVRWMLIGLRVAIVLTLILMLGEPVLRTTKFLSQDSVIIVLIDDSLSMDIVDKYSDRELVESLAEYLRSTEDTIESTSRYDLVRRVFRDDNLRIIERLRGKGQVAFFTFAGGLQRLEDFPRRKAGDPDLTPDELEVLPDYDVVRVDSRVQQTRVADALSDSVASIRAGGFGRNEENIAGFILLTDAQETGGGSAVSDVALRLRQRNIPIYSIGVGNPDDPKDIRVITLDVNDVVLAGDEVPFDVGVVAEGYEGERVTVELKFDGAVVDTDSVVLEGHGLRQTVRLDYRPPDPGQFTVTVEVEHRGGELFRENNSISRPIRVLDQKIRVLFADGPPRWEYRYLKNALVRDPTMEAQVFLFSADKRFIQESSPNVPPLGAFPETREELFKYHVVILGDVDVEGGAGQRYLSANQMALLKEFVYEVGGGVVFISGEGSNPGKYRDTDLYTLLPIEIPEGDRFSWAAGDAPISEPFHVKLTPVGKEHTVMRLVNDYERNVELWENPRRREFENLPGFYWFYEGGVAKHSAVVLARHEEKSRNALEDDNLVIFAFMNYGKGRTFFSAVDNTWRWRAGVDSRFFGRFWGQVVRFCATGRLLGETPRYSLSTDKTKYTLGETVNIESRIFDASMRPVDDPTVLAYHQADAEEGPAREIELKLDPVRGPGAYHGTLIANRLGEHELWLGSTSEKLAFRPFNVTVPAVELRDPRRNVSLLNEIATLTGGASFELHELGQAIDRLEGRSQSLRGSFEDDPLWDDLWLLFVFTGLIAIEWILRRTVRLL